MPGASIWASGTEAGPPGPQGPSGTLQVGDVLTGAAGTPATVTNVGTEQNAILNFRIPRGADGLGIQGPPGVDGAPGPQGSSGAPGTPGTKTIWGTIPPASNIGSDGDSYIDSNARLIYGPKTAGAWPTTPLPFSEAPSFVGYNALRNYGGSATLVHIVAVGLEGFFIRVATPGLLDDGAVTIIDSLGRAWIRLYEDKVSLAWFGAIGDKITDDTIAIQNFWKFLSANGSQGYVPPGTYTMSNVALTQLTNSFSVEVAENAEFVAAVGYPAGAAMFALGNAVTTNKSFRWVGGKFDARNQPFSTVGSGSGAAIITINASNCISCYVELVRTITGDNWLNAGGDSHLFIGGPSNITARIHEAIGAPDCAIYISRNFPAQTGQSLTVDGNFYRCNVGVIVKRRFETATVCATAVDCVTGAACGTADIQGFASANSGHGYVFRVNAKRTQHPVFLNAVSNVQVFVNAELMGVTIPGYTSPGVSAIQCRGVSNVQGFVNVTGMNPDIPVNSNCAGVFLGPITTELDGTIQAVKNQFYLFASGLGVPFIENGPGTNDNTFEGKLNDMLSIDPVVIGLLTKYKFQASNICYRSGEHRFKNAAGQITYTINDNGSDGVGIKNSGVNNLAYREWFSGPGNARTALDSVSGGSATANSGTRNFIAAAYVFTGASLDFNGVIRPAVDLTVDFASASRRYVNNYSQNFRPGAGDVIWTSGVGSPEGVVTAGKGSMYTRTDGGVATTLYIKETGAGNTGWAPK